jgi:Tol biopolymer transport system component
MPKKRTWQIRALLITVLLILLAALAGWWLTPRLVSFTPQESGGPVPGGAPLEIVFSRRMQVDTVERLLSTDPPREGVFSWQGSTLRFLPDEPWPSGGMVNVRIDRGARAAGFPQLPISSETSWSFQIDEPRLAYLYPSDEPSEIFSLDLRSGTITQLSNSPGGVLDFDVNTIGTAIYFNTDQGNGGTTLHRLDRQTGESQVLIVCERALCRYPQISPNENFLAYERTELGAPLDQDHPQVWLLDLASGDANPVADPEKHTESPKWSPNGLLTYYDRENLAFIVQDTQGRLVSQFPSQTGISGDWSPDGNYYLFPEIYLNEVSELTGLESVPSSRLLRYSLDGTRLDLTASDDVEDASPVFSTDGEWVTFGRKFLDLQRWTPGRQMWIIDTAGEVGHALTDDPLYNHYDFAWSPDGSQIAYARFNKDVLTEPPEIWIMNADGTGATRLITGGFSPQWIP